MSELFADREALIQWAENWAVKENLIDGDPEVIEALADALLASGVVRPPPDEETVARVIGNELSAAGLNLDGAPYSDDGHGNYWPIARELRDGLARAVLALFTEGGSK